MRRYGSRVHILPAAGQPTTVQMQACLQAVCSGKHKDHVAVANAGHLNQELRQHAARDEVIAAAPPGCDAVNLILRSKAPAVSGKHIPVACLLHTLCMWKQQGGEGTCSQAEAWEGLSSGIAGKALARSAATHATQQLQ
jgi:hypothetical protein